ncbi:MAG: FG-GAP-like repeat-containing protein, partial [Nanoarchaeota archaeon]
MFPGGAAYTYAIESPKGTNGLTPFLEISYNSQSVKQKPGILGAGWQLTQSFIYRDVNSTPANTTDDVFKLILNNIQHELIYNPSEKLYHTKLETYLKIENLTENPNMYWLVTAKDGTKYRFGYNPDSELQSSSGYNHSAKWSLDLIEDTHNNKIFYSYLENPFSGDIGAVYLDEITYNNDKQRAIKFNYENTPRPDWRLVYEQGNKINETRRLINITISANNNLVRKYQFQHTGLNTENTLTALSNIVRYGFDNISILHNISFEYYPDAKGYALYNDSSFSSPELFSDTSSIDFGVRLIDFNSDGFIDIVKSRQSTGEKKIFINNRKNNWTEETIWQLPVYIVDSAGIDAGVRFEDVNTDGFIDILHSRDQGNIQITYINNGTGWTENTQWKPPLFFINNNIDAGVQFIDFNGDGRIDILVAGDNTNQSYINTGSGWKNVSSTLVSPVEFILVKDTGVRIIDFNADGLPDIINTSSAYLNNGSGWVNYNGYSSPVGFSTGDSDTGVRIVDVNGDGLPDLL